ncbi:MAG: formyltransferase family protein [Acidobacteriota bacterium]|nr:formyltransferase family protein [Acidobacteriota bacterium]
MTLYIAAVDEPIYLVPYVRRVIESCGARVVGVAAVSGRPRRRRDSLSLALLALVIFSPAQWLRLARFKAGEWAAAIGLGTPRHRLSDVCQDLSVPFRRIESVNDAGFVAHLSDLGVDVLLHQTPQFLRAAVLRTPRLGVVNRHLSLLPAYRGAWPIFWQCAHREATVGVTIHLVDAGLDTGEILAQASVARQPSETTPKLLRRLFDRSVGLTCEALTRLEAGAPRMANAGPGASVYGTPRPIDVVRYLLGLPPRPQAG